MLISDPAGISDGFKSDSMQEPPFSLVLGTSPYGENKSRSTTTVKAKSGKLECASCAFMAANQTYPYC